jgi:hypothetical protein
MPSNVNYYIFSIVPCLRTQISYRVPLPAVHLHVFVAYIIVFLFLVSFVRYRRAVAVSIVSLLPFPADRSHR